MHFQWQRYSKKIADRLRKWRIKRLLRKLRAQLNSET
jgi:hypothetical protein